MSAYGGVFSESVAAPLWTAGIGAGLGVSGSEGVPPQSRACARRTLTLALSHKGRGDPLVAIRT